jgi:hypothetical protein
VTFEAPTLLSCTSVQQNQQNQIEKLLYIMAECRKKFGEDFNKTFYLAAILIWPTLTKKLNNGFFNEIIILAVNIVNYPKHVTALPDKYVKFNL